MTILLSLKSNALRAHSVFPLPRVFLSLSVCVHIVLNAGKTSKTVKKMLEIWFVVVQIHDKMA